MRLAAHSITELWQNAGSSYSRVVRCRGCAGGVWAGHARAQTQSRRGWRDLFKAGDQLAGATCCQCTL